MKHHDWVTYHRIAAEMVESMRIKGWSEWKLRPFGWVEPGLISLVYFFSVSKPWVLIPFNAFFHAAASVVLLLILAPFLSLKKKAFLWVVAPFALFPTSLLWVTQIHKDGIAFFSCLLFIYSMLQIAGPFFNRGSARTVLIGTPGVFVSVLSGWIVRPYLGDVFILELYLLSVGVTGWVIFQWKFFLREKERLMGLILLWVLSLSLRPLLDFGTYKHVAPISPPPQVFQESKGIGFDVPLVMPESASEKPKAIISKPVPGQKPVPVIPVADQWTKTGYLPDSIENKLYAVAQIRWGYANTLGTTNVDTTIHFRSAGDFLKYLPRALQVVYLLPNPLPSKFWSNPSGQESGLQKLLVRFEMIMVYLLLPFGLLQIFRFRRKFEVYGLFVSCTIFMVIYTYTVTNLGTLHRFRYGFMALILGLGMGLFLEGLEKLDVIFFKDKKARAVERSASDLVDGYQYS